MDTSTRFARYLRFRSTLDDPFVELDLSYSSMQEEDLAALQPSLAAAHAAMRALESGAVANPDEGRQVGHFWLRAPGLAPTPALEEQIREAIDGVSAVETQEITFEAL